MSKNRSDRVAADFQQDSHSKLTEMQRQVYSYSFLFSIDYIVEQFQKNHFYIPESKRHLIWSKRQQMKLIETLLLGLPVPFMFVILIDAEEEQYEVVDGSQRIQTLDAFMSDNLVLENLEILPLLNGFKFSDIHFIQRNKFKCRVFETFAIGKTIPRNIIQEIATRLDSGGTPL
ncbi:MAG: DUF262 domain-containing protein [Thiomargarita sp.]|nr:DUF262 domain-containing protein [Thiomargarita sp.]